MSYSTANAEAELKRFTRRRYETVDNIARQGGPDNVSAVKLMAVSSKETGIRNICGGANLNPDWKPGDPPNEKWIQSYEDHGLWQLNEVYNRVWLKSHKGCEEGTYRASYEHCLVKPRLVPRLSDQTLYAATRLDGLITQAKLAGAKDPVRVGVAAWNTGFYNALRGERDFNDPDHFTATGNYSADILERERAIRRALRGLGWS